MEKLSATGLTKRLAVRAAAIFLAPAATACPRMPPPAPPMNPEYAGSMFEEGREGVRPYPAAGRPTPPAVTTWAARTARILDLRDHLLNDHVVLVVMEATRTYHRGDGSDGWEAYTNRI